MKHYIAIALIVVGGLLMLSPLYSKERNSDRIADYYSNHGNAMPLPVAMQTNVDPYGWACIVIGLGMVVSGVHSARHL